METKKREYTVGKLRFTGADLAALAVFAILAVCFFMSAPYGITETDEAVYQVHAMRLLQGDRLFADDWTLTPFSTIFNFVPFAAYYAAVGSSAGALLFLRYLFAGLKLFFFAVVYVFLRSKGYWAVLAAAVFSGAFLFGIKTLNYYFITLCATLLPALILFVKEEPGPRQVVFSGFLFSCAVLAEPSMALVWIAYCLFVLCRWISAKKNAAFLRPFDFVLSPRTWRLLLYGVLLAAFTLFSVCAAVFMRTSPALLWQGFLQALNDPERSGKGIGLLTDRFSVIAIYVRIWHPALFYPFLLLLSAAIVTHRFTHKADAAFLIALTALGVAMAVRMLVYPMETVGGAVGETVCHTLPFGCMGAVFYAFTEKRDPRLLAFLVYAYAVILCADIISMSAFGAVSEPAAVASALLLRDYCREHPLQKQAAPEKKKREKKTQSRLLPAVLAALTVLLPVHEAAHTVYMARLHETERLLAKSDEPLDTRISVGALRGIVTTASLCENYEKCVRYVEKARALCENRFYAADLAMGVYLDAQLPIGAHSPFFYPNEGWERVSLWWEMHPDKKPDVVYIPYIRLTYMEYADQTPEEKLDFFRSVADLEVTEGEIGYIVKIVRWNTD